MTGTTNGCDKILAFRIIWKPQDSDTWKEFIKYETKQEAESYLENINPILRPACIVNGQQTLKAYDHGIIDYELIGKIESENLELREKVRKFEIELGRSLEYAKR
jgi:hypothetical protein